ncbi:hypothetical protein PC110_g23569 [Phytophthora cactorum]|uniref:Uncharacterized protein n=1 Tax=Phytophthora cactorum TaxID=29920 RepID=A0A329R7L3_9STRA|nr:hypothetical protein PC110_g23569 [Phytophthora cactorum]
MDRTLPLTVAHKAARMSWAEEDILNPGIWQYTVFSDEKSLIWMALMGSSTICVTCASQLTRSCDAKTVGGA